MNVWLRSLLHFVISSVCNALLGFAGLAGASALGANIKPLDWKQLGTVAASSAVWSVIMYLKQSPLPPDGAGPVPVVAARSGFVSFRALLAMAGASMVGVAFLLITGCAPLAPGADPLVVRTEQAQTDAKATFDLVLDVDNSNRPFFRTNAPPFHAFCEWLRVPTTVDQTNILPRAAALLQSLDDVKEAYVLGKATSNTLATAVLTLEAVVNQALQWESALTVITNAPAAAGATASAPAPKPAYVRDEELPPKPISK